MHIIRGLEAQFIRIFGCSSRFDVKNEPAGSFFVKIYHKCSELVVLADFSGIIPFLGLKTGLL
jgi:hypothetical protein